MCSLNMHSRETVKLTLRKYGSKLAREANLSHATKTRVMRDNDVAIMY